MSIRTRFATSAAAATVTLALAVTTFTLAAPARAEVAPTPAPTAVVSPTPTASATPAPAAVAQPATKKAASWPGMKRSGKKAKVVAYSRLTRKAKRVARKVRNDWRQIKVIGGWRAGSRYSGDHPAGRALDVMVPKWKKNAKVGRSIAKYFAKYHKKYKIHYVIYRQRIWTTANKRWRKMADRGGATANHFDHVHISVKR